LEIGIGDTFFQDKELNQLLPNFIDNEAIESNADTTPIKFGVI
jgi:hypothetical protein